MHVSSCLFYCLALPGCIGILIFTATILHVTYKILGLLSDSLIYTLAIEPSYVSGLKMVLTKENHIFNESSSPVQ